MVFLEYDYLSQILSLALSEYKIDPHKGKTCKEYQRKFKEYETKLKLFNSKFDNVNLLWDNFKLYLLDNFDYIYFSTWLGSDSKDPLTEFRILIESLYKELNVFKKIISNIKNSEKLVNKYLNLFKLLQEKYDSILCYINSNKNLEFFKYSNKLFSKNVKNIIINFNKLNNLSCDIDNPTFIFEKLDKDLLRYCIVFEANYRTKLIYIYVYVDLNKDSVSDVNFAFRFDFNFRINNLSFSSNDIFLENCLRSIDLM